MLNIATQLRFFRPPRRPGPRRGLTLIELLVVVSIMMLLVVITVPRMRPAMENRRIREAARSINVYLSSARSRAIETGRPCGVAIVRDENMPLAGSTLIQVETPPPYAGDVEGAAMRIMNATPATSFPNSTVLRAQIRSGHLSPGLLRWGDRVQFNHQGPLYRIVDDPADNLPPKTSYPVATDVGADFPLDPPDLRKGFINFSVGTPDASGWITDRWLTLVADGVYNVPWPAEWPPTSQPVPFQIFRQPVTSATLPLQLPRGVVIDLWYSGTTSGRFANTATKKGSLPYPTILFSPNGSVTQVAADTIGRVPAMEPIFLLVGRRDRVNPDPQQGAEDGRTNLADLENLWVAINPQTGYIVCAENSTGTNIDECRQYAREFQAMGGR